MTKSTIPKTLGAEIFEWLEKRETLNLPGAPLKDMPEKGLGSLQLKARKRQKLFRIRETASKEISDLTRLAELLPEDQLRQVFTVEQLRPLFDAIFNPEIRPKEKSPTFEDLLEKRRKRLLPLCFQVISMLDEYRFSAQMAGQLRNLTTSEGGFLPGLRAVYYRSMISEKKT